MITFDINKILNELEGPLSNESGFNSSLISRFVDLRDNKLRDFTAGDLRVMISQKMNLDYMNPLAIEILASNPFVEGDLYIADLLEQVLQVENGFWKQNEGLYYEFLEVLTEVKSTIETLLPAISKFDSTK